MMEIREIIDRFAAKVEYDRDQRSFNLLSTNFAFHQICKNAEWMIKKGYDPYGQISVLYLKKAYENVLKDEKISLYDLFCGKEDVSDEKELYDLLHSETVKRAEDVLTEKLRLMSCRIEGGKRIGNSDISFKEMLDSLELVVENLKKLKADVIKAGNPISKLTKYGAGIVIFPTYGECVTAMENASDGMYLCYIDACHTASGFFAFVIRSGNSLISIHDRIDEEYVGQHSCLNKRNGRWAENKSDIFPYSYIFSFEDYDHLGYAHSYHIDEEKCTSFMAAGKEYMQCTLSAMGEKAYLPLLLMMIMLTWQMENYVPDKKKQVFLSSLLPESRKFLEKNSNMLVPVNGTALAVLHDGLNLDFNKESLLDGSFSKEFEPPTNRCCPDPDRIYTRYFNDNQFLVDYYGSTFVPDIKSLFTETARNLLETGEKREYTPEYIGTEQSFRNQMYFEARKQLATHIRKRLKEDFESFGGDQGVREWLKEKLSHRKDFLGGLCVCLEEMLESNKVEKKYIVASSTEEDWFTMAENMKGGICNERQWGSICLNMREPIGGTWYCTLTGSKANKWFWFSPTSPKGLAFLTGIPVEELPVFLRNWHSHYKLYGNSLLDRTDKVASIRSPFYRENGYRLYFSLGFSRSGWRKIRKEYRNHVTEEMKEIFLVSNNQ